MGNGREIGEMRLDPATIAAAEQAAKNAGVDLTDWLNRTILDNVGESPRVAAGDDETGDAGGSALDMRTAEGAAAAAGVALTEWLNRAILAGARQQGAAGDAAPDQGPGPDLSAVAKSDRGAGKIALENILAQVVAEARAAKGAPPPGDPPEAAAGRARGPRRAPWLTAGMLVILALSAATIWALPRLDEFGFRLDSGRLHVQKLSPLRAPAKVPAKPPAKDPAKVPAKVPAKDPEKDPAAGPSASVAAQIEQFRAQAKKGDVNAQLTLGAIYLRGAGVKRDYAEAAKWFRMAGGRGGSAEAQYSLGVLMENGLGVTKDPMEALLWYQRAAQQNHPKALYNAGRIYAAGGIVPRNYAKARTYFERAAKQGIPEAQFNLAALYERGLGVKRDDVEAYRWYGLALAGGEKQAGKAIDRLAPRLTKEQIRRAKELIADFQKS